MTHEHQDAEGVQPVVEADRQLPDVDAAEIGRIASCAASSERPCTWWTCRPVLVVQVDGAGEARIERVDRPQDLQRLLGVRPPACR